MTDFQLKNMSWTCGTRKQIITIRNLNLFQVELAGTNISEYIHSEDIGNFELVEIDFYP